MRQEHLQHLACPECKSNLRIADIGRGDGERIETGSLQCIRCERRYDIIRHVPRFVPLENYASSFGLEWSHHARTQYDSYTGRPISETRFFEETRWPNDLQGQLLLEVGSGSGRFTEIALKTGAMVISMDYSYAVDANYASNGDQPNLLIVQGDLYRMPFHESYFDKLLCIGVLQHTPDVKGAFMALPAFLKPGGQLTVDVYRKFTGLKGLLVTRYWVRPFTRRIAPQRLYKWCKRYVTFMYPLAKRIHKIPFIGKNLNWALLIGDYMRHDLSGEVLLEWAVLDTFDMLAPTYDQPQTIETVRAWFEEAKLQHSDIHYGYNGIEARSVKP